MLELYILVRKTTSIKASYNQEELSIKKSMYKTSDKRDTTTVNGHKAIEVLYLHRNEKVPDPINVTLP